MTPTHGDPRTPSPRAARDADTDTERWLPDPSWPVPPRGWQLWAAAGSASGPGRARREIARDSSVHSCAPMHHTDDVLSEMPRLAAIEDASFTLPTRPSALVDEAWPSEERVDLLADRRAPRRLPEGTIGGFAALATLLLISVLVGGPIGGLVVLGVSTLLAASAALVRGGLSLTRVGGQRGAGLLLGAAVMALIAGSVAAHDRPGGPRGVEAALVPVSTLSSTSSAATSGQPGSDSDTETAYTAVPPSVATTRPSQASSTARADDATKGGAHAAPTTAAPARPATAATPAVPAEAAVPGGAGTPATPAVPATPATPAKPGVEASASVALPGLTLGGILTLSPDALSPKPAPTQTKAPTAPKPPKAPKTPKTPKATKATKATSSTKAAKAAKATTAAKAATATTTTKGAKATKATTATTSAKGAKASKAATASAVAAARSVLASALG